MESQLPLFLLIFFLVGCGNNPRLNPDEENPSIPNTPKYEDSFWTISPQPILTLGKENGEDHDQFYRSFSALKLDNGNLMISNSGTHEIRFYDEAGNFLKTVGQKGKGPGDFGDFSNMRITRLPNNIFAVADFANNRVQIFDGEGNRVKIHNQLKIDGVGRPLVVDVFSDGGWLLWSSVGSGASRGDPGDIIQKELAFHRLHPDWTYDKILYQLPARTRYVNKYAGITNFPFIPLTPDPLYVADSKNSVLFSTGEKPELVRIDTSGTVVDTLKWYFPRRDVDDVWERYKKEDYLSGLSGDRRAQFEHFLKQDLPLPEKVPALSEIKVDQDGNIWAQRFNFSWEDQKTWDILDDEGQWMGSLQLPSDLTITDIGKDYLLGYSYESGFQQINMYNLNK